MGLLGRINPLRGVDTGLSVGFLVFCGDTRVMHCQNCESERLWLVLISELE